MYISKGAKTVTEQLPSQFSEITDDVTTQGLIILTVRIEFSKHLANLCIFVEKFFSLLIGEEELHQHVDEEPVLDDQFIVLGVFGIGTLFDGLTHAFEDIFSVFSYDLVIFIPSWYR